MLPTDCLRLRESDFRLVCQVAAIAISVKQPQSHDGEALVVVSRHSHSVTAKNQSILLIVN
jgi:hypothetical protein